MRGVLAKLLGWGPVHRRAGFMGWPPGQPPRAPMLRLAPHMVNAAVVVLKFLIIFEQELPHFHFALNCKMTLTESSGPQSRHRHRLCHQPCWDELGEGCAVFRGEKGVGAT